jgi:hypothetical protein
MREFFISLNILNILKDCQRIYGNLYSPWSSMTSRIKMLFNITCSEIDLSVRSNIHLTFLWVDAHIVTEYLCIIVMSMVCQFASIRKT